MALTKIKMNTQDAPSAKMAECYITVNGRVILMFCAKNAEFKVSKETGDVKVLGRVMTGKKATGMEGSFTMTIIKVTDMFDKMVLDYAKTGKDTYFDAQVTSEDETSSIGRSTKIYKNCIIDGDVLLSMFDADGEFIEQEISGFFDSWEAPESYKEPAGM